MSSVCHCDEYLAPDTLEFRSRRCPARRLHVDDVTRATYVTMGAETGAEVSAGSAQSGGSPIFSLLLEQQQVALIKAGMLNDRSSVSHTVEMWCDLAQPWLTHIENTRR